MHYLFNCLKFFRRRKVTADNEYNNKIVYDKDNGREMYEQNK
jgi:hypothetical protein